MHGDEHSELRASDSCPGSATLAVWPWTSPFSSRCFNFPLNEMGKCLLTGRLLSSSPFLSSRRLFPEAQTPLLPMGSCQAGHYLHFCLAHHPPLVCATLILLLLGLSGLGLGGFLLTHRTDLRSPDIPQVSTHPPAHPSPAGHFLLLTSSHLSSPSFCTQDWVSFLRSFGQLTLCPVNGTVTGKGRGSHIVGLLTTLNFGDGPDRNKTQTFQAQVQGSRMGLKGEIKEELWGWISEHSGVGPCL